MTTNKQLPNSFSSLTVKYTDHIKLSQQLKSSLQHLNTIPQGIQKIIQYFLMSGILIISTIQKHMIHEWKFTFIKSPCEHIFNIKSFDFWDLLQKNHKVVNYVAGTVIPSVQSLFSTCHSLNIVWVDGICMISEAAQRDTTVGIHVYGCRIVLHKLQVVPTELLAGCSEHLYHFDFVRIQYQILIWWCELIFFWYLVMGHVMSQSFLAFKEVDFVHKQYCAACLLAGKLG